MAADRREERVEGDVVEYVVGHEDQVVRPWRRRERKGASNSSLQLLEVGRRVARNDANPGSPRG